MASVKGDDDDGDEPFAAAFHPGREVGVAVEAQHLDADEGGEGYEDSVDEEEVEGSEEVVPLRRGEAVARGAERRHEGRGYGHAGNHLPLALGRQRQHAGGAAAEGYEHVVEGGGGARQQLAAGLAQGREEEVERSREHRDDGGHAVVAQRAPQQLVVADAHAQAHADDGAHEGRDEHGADDDRRRVDVEPQRGYQDGEHENPQVGAAEHHAGAHLLYHLALVLAVAREAEVVVEYAE